MKKLSSKDLDNIADKTEEIISKATIGAIALGILSLVILFLVFALKWIGLPIGTFVILFIGGGAVLSYLVGNWIIKSVEQKIQRDSKSANQ